MAKSKKEELNKKKSEAKSIMNHKQLNACNVIIHSASTAAAAAGAIPIAIADAIPISATQVTMVLSLAKVFDQKISEATANAIIRAAASTFIGRTVVKFIPVIGWGISAAVAASITEIIGWTAAVDFAKMAKSKWTEEHTQKDTDNTYSEETQEERNEQEKMINHLKERAMPFLNKEKNISENKEEYEKLIKDFEKVIDLLDNELKKIYNVLNDLILDEF